MSGQRRNQSENRNAELTDLGVKVPLYEPLDEVFHLPDGADPAAVHRETLVDDDGRDLEGLVDDQDMSEEALARRLVQEKAA